MAPMNSALKPTILRTFAEYRAWRYAQSKTIGFVPTMGALHAGHLSLATQASRENGLVVMSIFVNPAQFAPTEDLEKYPRTLDADLDKIRKTGLVDILFLPSARELYPAGIEQDVTKQVGSFVSVLGLSHQLEGSIRPTFFRGVATVLTKFLNIIRPTRLYLGQKDIQQSIVVRRMMRDLCFDTELVVGATVREPDGLAMSSRNVYLTPENRLKATCLYRALRTVQDAFEVEGERSCERLKARAREILDGVDGIVVEYVSIADMHALVEMDHIGSGDVAVVSAAIRLGDTRILDNVILDKT